MKNIVKLVVAVSLMALTSTFVVAEDAVLREGSLNGAFSSWGKSSLQGDWKIVSEGDQLFIELGSNFAAKKGPDVKIFLSPTAAADINGKNAAEGAVFIKLISDFKGAARIPIPAGTNLDDYQTLVFHCLEFSKLWGTSALS